VRVDSPKNASTIALFSHPGINRTEQPDRQLINQTAIAQTAFGMPAPSPLLRCCHHCCCLLPFLPPKKPVQTVLQSFFSASFKIWRPCLPPGCRYCFRCYCHHWCPLTPRSGCDFYHTQLIPAIAFPLFVNLPGPGQPSGPTPDIVQSYSNLTHPQANAGATHYCKVVCCRNTSGANPRGLPAD